MTTTTTAPGWSAIPHVQLDQELGRGSHSVVYRGHHGPHPVAVKVALHSRADGADNPRFLREAALLATLRHPGFPEIYDVGEVDGHAYLVMELIEGTTLADSLRAGSLGTDAVVRLAREMASALAAVHRRGLVHRDVKPRNVVFDAEGRARLIDFGLVARTTHEGADGVAGTFVYSAPEQTRMLKRPVDGRADLYALGVVLYECVTGQPPFMAEQAAELIRQHAVTRPTAATRIAPDSDPVLAAIIEKLLAKDPDDRYQTGQGLAADLARLDALRAEHDQGFELSLGRDDLHFGVLREAALVGRDHEYTALQERWQAARAGHGSLVLLEGQAGCGKTRLARELSFQARGQGALILSSHAAPGERAPFAALQSTVDSLLDQFNRMPEAERVRFRERARQAAGDSAPLLSRFSPRLGVLLGADAESDEGLGASDQFFEAVSGFVVHLAHQWGGIVFALEDIQWFDDASLRVAERVVTRLQGTPLLVLATERIPDEQPRATSRLHRHAGDRDVIHLENLDAHDIQAFACTYLGTESVPTELIDALTTRSGGSPLLASGYLRAMLEHGLLRPYWGSWIFDSGGLDQIELAGDILELMGARAEGLGADAVQALAAAAVIGPRFELDLLLEVVDGDDETVSRALGEAISNCLVEQIDGRFYAFVHERVRSACLDKLALGQERELHQRIADCLYARRSTDDADIYAIATHYACGHGDRHPQRVFETSLEAGQRALRSYAFEESYRYLARANDFAGGAGVDVPASLLEGLGEACARTGRHQQAVEHLQQALQQTSDGVHRARLRAVLAQVHVWDSFHTQKAWHQVEAIFRELGRSLPRTRIGRVITSLVYFALGLLVAKTGWGFGGARGKDRERTRILTQTLKSAGHVAYWSMQPVFTVLLVLRSLYFAHRLGRSAELVQTYVGSSLVFAAVGRNSSSRRFGDQAVQIADDLQDKALAAYSRMNRSIACNARGECLEGERQMKRVLTDRGRWLDVGEYTQGCTDLSWNLHLRGYPREGLQWVQWGLERERQASPQRGQIFLPTKASACLVMLGRVDEASNHLEYARSIADAAPDDRYRQANYLSHLIFFHLEQRHAGQTLEAVRRYRRLGIAPKRTPFHFRNFFVFQAYAWLLRCEDHGADASSLEGLSQSLEELRVTAYTGHPLFLGHLRVLEAALFRLQGQGALALDKLDEAERLAESHDNAWATFEAKRQRALLCRERGQSRAEGRLAEEAFALALDTESKARARLIRRDFDLGRTSSMSNTPTTHGETTRPPTEARTVHLERHVEALVRVSQVSLSVLDGLQQARAILDEVVSLFGAERAILFLRTQDDQLSLFAARNSAGSDLQDTAGYATRLVEDVYAHEVPRVVGGGDDAARVGSESAIAYDLRSIVAAPLKVRDRLVGVVYLDNRLAKGVFTSDDVEILTAICNHIAVAIETARTAQLEMQYKTEREKRELAETLRALVGQAGPETSERSLVERLVRYAGQLVPAARVAYFRRAEDGWHVEGTTQTELSDLEGSRRSSVLDAMGGDGRRRLLRADTPEFANVPVLGAGCAAWLGAPVLVGDEVSGVLALDTRLPHGLDENHLELTQALADQASVALENARLFARVQQLATHDELTGLRNRRALFDTAWQELRRAKRYGKTLSVVMVDVDHFKQVNDTHGHRVGDEVLREIAERLQECIRDVDVLGRYGGEELLVLAPETTGEEAVRTVAERMRARVAAHPVHSSAGPQSITVSLGVTESAAADEQPEDLFARADSALYRAKHEGRNRVALGPSPPDQAGPATPSEGQN